MVLERDPDSEVGTTARQVLDTIFTKMVVAEWDRKGSRVFTTKPQHHPSSQPEQISDWWQTVSDPA